MTGPMCPMGHMEIACPNLPVLCPKKAKLDLRPVYREVNCKRLFRACAPAGHFIISMQRAPAFLGLSALCPDDALHFISEVSPMNNEIALASQNPFEALKMVRPDGSEYWSARDLQEALGYEKWERFNDSISRAMVSCESTGYNVKDQFPGAGKMIETGKGARREVLDYHLTRYACYLTAMNGDPRKSEIAAAQTYFAIKTREAEVSQARPALDMSDPLILAQHYVESETHRRVLAAENVELRQVLVVAAPKVESFDAYIGTEGLHNFNTAAKLVGWGRNKMLEELRRRKILMSGGDSQNVPYQHFIDKGYFEVKVRSWRSPAGEGVATTAFVTPKGIGYLNGLIGKPGRTEATNPPRPIQRGQPSKRESALLFVHQLQDQE